MPKVKKPAFEFAVLGKPQQRGSKKAFLPKDGTRPIITDDNKKSGPWMAEIRHAIQLELATRLGFKLLHGPIILEAEFRFARPKSHYGTGRNAGILKATAPPVHSQSPDLAKLVRCLEDAITGLVWRDDKQVYYYRDVHRVWTEGPAGVTVAIFEGLPGTAPSTPFCKD